jgi:hypothetical protein
MGEEAGEHLHHACEEPALVGGQRRPVGDPRRAFGERRPGGRDAARHLAREDLDRHASQPASKRPR